MGQGSCTSSCLILIILQSEVPLRTGSYFLLALWKGVVEEGDVAGSVRGEAGLLEGCVLLVPFLISSYPKGREQVGGQLWIRACVGLPSMLSFPVSFPDAISLVGLEEGRAAVSETQNSLTLTCRQQQ